MSNNNSNRNRNSRRYRNKKNNDDAQNSEGSQKNSWYCLHKDFPKSNLTNFQTKHLSLILPITTRAIGLLIQRIFLYGENDLNVLSRALYRFALHQLELKLNHAMRQQCSPNIGGFEDYENAYVSDEKRDICYKLGTYFGNVSDLIESVGLVKDGSGTLYIPRVPKRVDGPDGLDPCLITINSLRSYVEGLSDHQTSLETRRHFHEYNPLPAATWTKEGDEHHPLLLNPDEIMPRDYDATSLLKDLHVIQNFISLAPPLRDGFPVSQENVDYSKAGHPNMLLSYKIDDSSRYLDEPWFTQHSKLFGEIPREASVKNFRVFSVRRISLSDDVTSDEIQHDGQIFRNPRAKPPRKMPLTTRGLGFLVKNLVRFLSLDKDSELRMMHALYRASLQRITNNQINIHVYSQFGRFRVLENYLSLCRAVCAPSLNANFIIPERTEDPDYDYDPCLIQFDNLREYCVALSSTSTPFGVRKYFYDHSPIPGALWNNGDVGPILANPDEIIPPSYEAQTGFRTDMQTMANCIDQYYATRYDYSSDEDFFSREREFSKIVTSEICKAPNVGYKELQVLLSSTNILPFGLESENAPIEERAFWSPSRNVPDMAKCLAGYYLFGEIPRAEAVKNFDDFFPRQLECARSLWHNKPDYYRLW